MANNTLSIYAVIRRAKNAFKVAYPNAQNVNAVYLGEA